MALALYDRVQQTGTANTTVSFTLSGTVTGFQSFSAIGNGNTTYYAATDLSGNWEVGLGTYSTTGPTLTRTTIYSSSNAGSAVTFSGAVNVFVTYPAKNSVVSSNNSGTSGQVLTSGGSGVAPTWTTPTTGTVTSVALSGGTTGLTVSGSPITTSGTITLAGTLAIANGGSGATTAQTAMNAFSGAVTSGSYLRGNGTNVVMSAIQTADVPTLNQNTTGSAATLTNGRTIAITGDLAYTSPSFNGSTNVTAAGTLATVNANVGAFTNASVTVNAKGLVTAVSSGTAPVTSVTGTSPVVSSGGATPAISMPAATSLVNGYLKSTDWTTFNGKSNTTGTVTSVAASVPTFLSIAGSPITTSGTLAITLSGTALPVANGGTGSTTGYGLAKAWVNFNGTTGAINGTAFNVSSVTVNASGNYNINFTTAMPNANYAGSFCGNGLAQIPVFYSPTTGYLQALYYDTTGTPVSPTICVATIFST
jgi:hypothetical protein